MRFWKLLPVLSVLAFACDNGTTDDSDTDTDPGTDDPDAMAAFINTDKAPIGDFACFTPGGAWLEQAVDAAKVATATATGQIIDFQSDEPVADADIEVWTNDTVSGPAQLTGTSDGGGNVTLNNMPTCAPITYRTSTQLDEAKDTYEAHQIYGADAAISDEWNSVSTDTYAIIPGLLGVTVLTDKGVIAGASYDCNGDPIEGAQVVVKDASGRIPDTLVVNYFVSSFPNRNQLETSADGLWVAMNVPEGELTVELYVKGADGYDLLGATVLPSKPDSINISNIYTGFGDGVRYPDSCLQ